MARQYDRNRDDEGRFAGSSRGGRWREDDYDDRGRGGQFGHGQVPSRDDHGRFMSEDDDQRGGREHGRGDGQRDYYGSQAGGRTRDVRDDYDGELGRGARGGYPEDDFSRGGYGGYGGPRSDRDRYERGRFRDDDRGSRGQNRYGRWQDDYGGSEQRDYEAARYPSGGFSGDRYGIRDEYGGDYRHRGSQSRQDWQREQGGNYREDRDERGRFQSRDDAHDRGGSRERGGMQGRGGTQDRSDSRGREDHRGWYGDSRGHSHAARLGWRHRDH